LFVFAAGLCACQRDQSDQNIAINNNAADVEALPPDESSATPTDQLENGADNADVSDLNAESNAY